MKSRPFRERLGLAAAGLVEAYRRERSFRVHMRFAIAAAIALAVIRPQPVWWTLIDLLIAFELIIRRWKAYRSDASRHPSGSKVIRDMAAGAVLLLSIAALIVGVAMAIDNMPRLMGELEALGGER